MSYGGHVLVRFGVTRSRKVRAWIRSGKAVEARIDLFWSGASRLGRAVVARSGLVRSGGVRLGRARRGKAVQFWAGAVRYGQVG